MSYQDQKYFTSSVNLKKTLSEYGVAIIPNVLNEDEIQQMNRGMWDYLEHVTQKFTIPINRNDSETWVQFLKLFPKHSMLLQQFQIGHAQFCWDIRQNPKIINIFSILWKIPPEKLLTSFDGAAFHFPPEETNRGWHRQTWYHTDQSFMRPDFECIQSWVTGYDVEEGDATLAFLEKSHIHHKEFQEYHNINDKSNWYKLSEKEQSFYHDKGCPEMRIKCPAGSMVFWDSRTIHCGTECTKSRKNKKIRNVVYVCMTPRSLASEANLRKKQKALNEKRTTSHWPHKPKLFPLKPRLYPGDEFPNVTDIPDPQLTELGKIIAGY